MRIEIGFQMGFSVPAPTPMMLQLHVYPYRYPFVRQERLSFTPGTPSETFLDMFGNAVTRLVAPAGVFTIACDAQVQTTDMPDLVDINAMQVPINQLPYDVLRYLVASRYCEIDQLSDFAWKTFGLGPTGYLRVQAVCNWVHNHIRFGYQYARSTKTAYDAFSEQQGVCRDFAHLAITLCRCLGFPARYATGYLGDIGVPADPSPMDFSAWFEVYLSSGWYTFDARHNHPRQGRILMAYGRDAAETALTTSYGPTLLQQFTVVSNLVS